MSTIMSIVGASRRSGWAKLFLLPKINVSLPNTHRATLYHTALLDTANGDKQATRHLIHCRVVVFAVTYGQGARHETVTYYLALTETAKRKKKINPQIQLQ